MIYNLSLKWVPRDDNALADSISKYFDTDNWSITNETYEFIQLQFDRFAINRFADPDNRKCICFDSRFHAPTVENVNTFTSNWGSDFNWLCPPITMIGETSKHAKLCRATGVLFVPEWHSSYFWPLLTSDGKHFLPFVQRYLVLDPFFTNHCQRPSVFTGFAKFRSLALLINW